MLRSGAWLVVVSRCGYWAAYVRCSGCCWVCVFGGLCFLDRRALFVHGCGGVGAWVLVWCVPCWVCDLVFCGCDYRCAANTVSGVCSVSGFSEPSKKVMGQGSVSRVGLVRIRIFSVSSLSYSVAT